MSGKKEPIAFATENDVLNGLGMLFMQASDEPCADLCGRTHLLVARGHQARYRLRIRRAMPRRTAAYIHLLNSGAACLDACGECTDENGNHVMKEWWNVTDEDIKKMTDATVWCEAGLRQLPRRRILLATSPPDAEMPVTMIRLNLVKGLGPTLQIAEGWTVNLPDEVY